MQFKLDGNAIPAHSISFQILIYKNNIIAQNVSRPINIWFIFKHNIKHSNNQIIAIIAKTNAALKNS